ncbi:MAG: DUF1576 domain-containing protein [Bacilli bacterium]
MKKSNEELGWLGLQYIVLILILFFIYGIVRYDDNVISGFITIITSTSILITDYLTIAGFSATILNVILILVFNLALLKINKIKVRGVTFAAFFTVFGFAFFGKNIVNILPIYLGTYLFSRYEEEKFSKYLVIAMFATGLAPVVSFGFDSSIFQILLGILLGILYGFIIPTFSAHVIRFHNGYSLYNIGFAGGIYAILVYGILKIFGIENTIISDFETSYSLELNLIILLISVMYLVLGFRGQTNNKSYKKLLSMSGRAVTDFTMIFGKSLTYKNIGIVGILTLIVMILSRVPTSGIVFGAACTIIGFASFGKHPRNILPLIIGVLIAGFAVNREIDSSILIIAMFSTTLAPVAGDFGVFAGLIAGVMHYSIAVNTADWQGGMNLYNNGFASGFVAAIMGSVLDTIDLNKYFRKREC